MTQAAALALPEVERIFLTGSGRGETHALTLSDGRPNPHPQAGAPYRGITNVQIAEMAREPAEVPKDDAPWFIPSDYREHDGRSHRAQAEHGRFWWLVADVDQNDLAKDHVSDALAPLVGDAASLIYATKSSRPGARRWRILVPLAEGIPGADYPDTASAFYRCLQDASGGTLISDEPLRRTGQLVYLPNRGEHYEVEIRDGGPPLLLDMDHPIIRERERERATRALAEADAKAALARKRAQRERDRPATGDESPVETFNARHSVSEMLDRYGYSRNGQSDDWRSPYQTSGSYATRGNDSEGYWTSLSGSDAAADLGMESKSGARTGDAFDLFVHFEHGGDFNAAVASYGAEIKPFKKIARPGGEGTFQEMPMVDSLHAASDAAPSAESTLPDNDVDLSHDALALELGEAAFDKNARYVATWTKWHFWAGTHWAADDRLDHMTRTRAFLRDKAADLTAWAKKKAAEIDAKEGEGKGDKLRAWAKDTSRSLGNKQTVAAVESLARSNRASVAVADDFDADPLLLGTPGGIVDLRTGVLRIADRSDMVTKLTACTSAPAGSTPQRWLTFLTEVFAGDAETIAFMQRAAGYALTGLTTEHKLLFLYGTGRNGKSTFLDTLFWLLGLYARRAAAETFLHTMGDKHATGVAGLQGARLVVGSELPVGKTWDESVIKDLTGGDVMTARYMRGDFFDFKPQLTLLIAGNNQPSFRGVDEAIRSRVVLVPFTVTIPAEKRDKHLSEKLRQEGPEILRWAIEGALQWQAHGLMVPPAVQAASQAYMDEEDTLGQFLSDETEIDPGSFVLTADLHQRFTQWCEKQGLHPWTLRTLQKDMNTRGYAHCRRNYGRGFQGLRLKR